MNDSPVDCQNREWTEPQRDEGDRRMAVDEVVVERKTIPPTFRRRRKSTSLYTREALGASRTSPPTVTHLPCIGIVGTPIIRPKRLLK